MKPMTPGVSKAARVRAYLTGLVLTAGLSGVAVRAWAMQIDEGAHYRAEAERQHELRLAIPAPRGDVLDARGRALAVSADAESIWANPHDVHDVAATAEQLARILGSDPRVLEAKLAGDHRFVWIERHVAPDIARRVRGAKLAGVEVAHEPRRWYPGGAIAGPVIGRADIDGNGVDGIELAMNDQLAGKSGEALALRDARGRTMLAGGLARAEAGATVHLSLDRSIQEIAEAALAHGLAVNQAKSGVAVVVEVATGRVLALATSPTYDPNTEDGHGARDKPVTDAFEAGSVMKVFSVASALDAGVVTPDSEFQIGNQLVVGRRAIHDTHFAAYLTVGGIIKHSSNIGAAQIALRLGSAKLYDGLRRFGFGARTGIELPGEQVGMMRPAARWRDVDLAHIAFGYGITVTPIQIAAAIAAIGDDGMYHAPRIVDEVVDGAGHVVYQPQALARRVVSARTAAEVRTMLASVFDKGKDGGTAGTIDVPGFRCGGKTGTAYKFDTAAHHYTTDHYLASFAGLAPIDHPQLAIVVMIDDPSGREHYGGQVSGPVFAAIATETLRYLGVPGDPVPGEPGSSWTDALTALVHLPAAADAGGRRPDAPSPGAIPDFTGLSLARALAVARENHVDLDIHGAGHVMSQEPPPGAPAARRVVLQLTDEH